MLRRGDMHDVESAIATEHGVCLRKMLCHAQYSIVIGGDDLNRPSGDVDVPLGQHRRSFSGRVALALILIVKPDLEADGLLKLEFQELGDQQRLLH